MDSAWPRGDPDASSARARDPAITIVVPGATAWAWRAASQILISPIGLASRRDMASRVIPIALAASPGVRPEAWRIDRSRPPGFFRGLGPRLTGRSAGRRP